MFKAIKTTFGVLIGTVGFLTWNSYLFNVGKIAGHNEMKKILDKITDEFKAAHPDLFEDTEEDEAD